MFEVVPHKGNEFTEELVPLGRNDRRIRDLGDDSAASLRARRSRLGRPAAIPGGRDRYQATAVRRPPG